MLTEFVTGKMQLFVATRDFGLNFDDPKTTPSVKIREGQTVLYDGVSATYKKDGTVVTGRCRSLKSAINSAQWLIPTVLPSETTDEFSESLRKADESTDEFSELLQSKEDVPEEELPVKTEDFDGLRGGSFDSYATENNDGVYVAPPPSEKKKSRIILEQDVIVKEFDTKKKIEGQKSGKLEVAGDQVAVKQVGAISVNSTTAVVNQPAKRDVKILRADEMGAEGTIPLKMSKTSSTEAPKEKNTFLVDNTTPRTVSEDMTREEIQRITKVIKADDSQDARVVGTIKKGLKVKEIDGITFRKTDSPLDVTLKKVASPTEMTVTTRVGSGSTPVEDPIGSTVKASESVVPQEVELQEVDSNAENVSAKEAEAKRLHDEAAAKKAQQRADARKKSSTETQKLMEGEKKPSTKKPTKKTASRKKTVKPKAEPEEVVTPAEGNADNYLLMLPDDWGKLHWVKKEQFIKELTDVGFIKFILSVETINAVQKACVERLKELEQEAAG